MDTAFVSFMKANTNHYLHFTCLKGLLSFRLDELDMNCIPFRTYQKMLQLDLLAELLPLLPFFRQVLEIRNRMEDAAVFTEPQE